MVVAIMHDDDTPIEQEPEQPEAYWTEAQWEQFMLENERLMDRYQKVWEESPDKNWKDPLDLYYKVHYDLDALEEAGGGEEPIAKEESEAEKDLGASEARPSETEPADEIDNFRKLSAYQLAFAFASAALDYMKRAEHERRGQNPLREQFCHHALRIAADIAGAHGMGYDEEVLCGNIVKHRLALGHAREAQRLLQALIERNGPDPESSALLARVGPIIKVLDERIAELRAKVWWDQ